MLFFEDFGKRTLLGEMLYALMKITCEYFSVILLSWANTDKIYYNPPWFRGRILINSKIHDNPALSCASRKAKNGQLSDR